MKQRIACYVITKTLASRTGSDKLPAWVSGHIQHCESCRLESAAQKKLRSVLMKSAECEDVCNLTWSELRTSLPAFSRKRRGVSSLTYAAAAVVVILALIPTAGLYHVQGPQTETRPPVVAKATVQPRLDVQTHTLPAPNPIVLHQVTAHRKTVQIAKNVASHRQHIAHSERIARTIAIEKKVPTVTPPEAPTPEPEVNVAGNSTTVAATVSQEELSYETGRLIVTAVNKLAENTQDSKCIEIRRKLKAKVLSQIRKIDENT